jgi:hypothetical protein
MHGCSSSSFVLVILRRVLVHIHIIYIRVLEENLPAPRFHKLPARKRRLACVCETNLREVEEQGPPVDSGGTAVDLKSERRSEAPKRMRKH